MGHDEHSCHCFVQTHVCWDLWWFQLTVRNLSCEFKPEHEDWYRAKRKLHWNRPNCSASENLLWAQVLDLCPRQPKSQYSWRVTFCHFEETGNLILVDTSWYKLIQVDTELAISHYLCKKHNCSTAGTVGPFYYALELRGSVLAWEHTVEGSEQNLNDQKLTTLEPADQAPLLLRARQRRPPGPSKRRAAVARARRGRGRRRRGDLRGAANGSPPHPFPPLEAPLGAGAACPAGAAGGSLRRVLLAGGAPRGERGLRALRRDCCCAGPRGSARAWGHWQSAPAACLHEGFRGHGALRRRLRARREPR